MPTSGRIEWYDRKRGFGVLVTDSGERFAFDGEKGWAEAGTSVIVEWTRARAGQWNVPSAIRAAGAKSEREKRPSFTLEGWLRGFGQRCDKLRNVSAEALLAACEGDLSPFATRPGGRWELGEGTGEEADVILRAIAELGRVDPDWSEHHRWVRALDATDTEEWDDLARMIGVDPAAITARMHPGRVPAGSWELVRDFLPTCNALAPSEDRLFSVESDFGDHLVIAMPSTCCTRLVADGYLVVDVPPTPSPKSSASTSWWNRWRRWLD